MGEMTDPTDRNVVFRPHPRTMRKHELLSRTAVACRYVRNRVWGENPRQYEESVSAEAYSQPHGPDARIAEHRASMRPVNPSFLTLGRAFTTLRRCTPWGSDGSFGRVRYTLRDPADAWRKFLQGTVAAPGTNGKAKAGLNREIGKAGWARLRSGPEYKAQTVLPAHAAYPSQACNECGSVNAVADRNRVPMRGLRP